MSVSGIKEQIADLKRSINSVNHGYQTGYVCALSAVEGMLADYGEWISVKDGLPEAKEEVRVFCKTTGGFSYQCHAAYIPRKTVVSEGNWDGECTEYDEETDEYFVLEGWYERIHNWDAYSYIGIGDFVTHWMPLPEPPEEEAE